MPNFSLVQLLKYPPFEALLIAFNGVHGTTLNPRYVEIDGVPAATGRSVQVKLKARTDLPNAEEKKFFSEGTITVERLNLSELFNEPFYLDYPGEIVSHDVANAITKVTGIVFDRKDFVDEVINLTNSKLKAAPTSLRWYGEIEIKYVGQLDPVPLAGVLSSTVPALQCDVNIPTLSLAQVLNSTLPALERPL